MAEKIKKYNIKLPSGDVINVKNLFEILKVISTTGKTFTEENLIKTGSPIGEGNLSRILSYLKYLGFILETRGLEDSNGEQKKTQKWHQVDNTEMFDLFYDFKAGREESAKQRFREVIKNHDLYQGIKEELIKNNPAPTLLDLENYYKSKSPGKTPGYYQRGVRFTILLLSFCNLITKEGNYFKLIESQEEKERGSPEENSTEEIREKEKISLKENKYIVNIFGENAKFEFPLNNPSDIEDIEAVLNIIRKKLN